MKPVLNKKPTVEPGMKIKLINGKNVYIGDREAYDWGWAEIVYKIEGKIIQFERFPLVDWYTVDMPWEIEEEK